MAKEQKSSGKLKVTRLSDTEILLERVFDAPRHLVFEAISKPEHVRRWWACMDGYRMTICEIDFRVGGKWRYVMVGPDGADLGFNGEYFEIDAPAKVKSSEIYEPFPDHPAICTLTLEEPAKGKTYYRNVVVHDTKEACDGHLNSGMEFGANLAFDRVEEIAQELAGSPRGGAGTTNVQAAQT
jgi:uncharacterized protein YndB with AHSA1/START domain